MGLGSSATSGQRWGTRVPLRHPVTIQWESHGLTGMLHTISVSGCFVEIAFPYPIGAELSLAFRLDPHTPPVTITGKVVMRNLGGIGVRFLYQDQELQLMLKWWIDAHGSRPSAA